ITRRSERCSETSSRGPAGRSDLEPVWRGARAHHASAGRKGESTIRFDVPPPRCPFGRLLLVSACARSEMCLPETATEIAERGGAEAGCFVAESDQRRGPALGYSAGAAGRWKRRFGIDGLWPRMGQTMARPRSRL